MDGMGVSKQNIALIIHIIMADLQMNDVRC